MTAISSTGITSSTDDHDDLNRQHQPPIASATVATYITSHHNRIPDYCRLPRDQGPCRGYYQNWYYSLDEGQCASFVYGGCGGNLNRFLTLEKCEQACRPRELTDEEEPKPSDNPEVIFFHMII